MTFLDEKYECLVAAIAGIDMATQALNVGDIQPETVVALDRLRRELNMQRLHALGNGARPPYFVSDLLEQSSGLLRDMESQS